jgi:AraC-like DNA-binding protein
MSHRKAPNEISDSADGLSVVAFAIELSAAFATPSHVHARGQMIGCSRGVVSVLTEGSAWVVPPGYAIWLPPHQVHGGQSFGPGAGWSLYVAPSACERLFLQTRTVAVPPLLREAILRATLWDNDDATSGRQRICELIVDEIASLPAEDLGLPLPRDARLQRIARSLLDHPGDSRTVDEWARWAGITARTLSRRFPQETGLTFTEWRHRARLMRALERLAEGDAVTTVALDLGYSSVSGFIALFRRAFGVTPAAHPLRRAELAPVPHVRPRTRVR